MFILLLGQRFFVTRWLEEERLNLLASVVMVRSDIALLGIGFPPVQGLRFSAVLFCYNL